MRWLRASLVLALLFWAAPAGAVPALVRQSAKVTGTGTAPLATPFSFGVLPAVGNVMVVTVFGWTSVGNPGYTVADNQGNTYTSRAVSNTATSGEARIFSAPINTSAGTFTVTVTNNGSGSSTINFNAQEWSGISAVPNQSTSTTGSPNPPAPQTGTMPTTTVANAALVGVVKLDTNTGAWAANGAGSVPSAGWTLEINEVNDGTNGAGATADVIVSATGAYVHIWSVTGSAGWAGCIAAFPVPTAGGSPQRALTGVGT